VWRIVNESDGTLQIQSEIGAGTFVTLQASEQRRPRGKNAP